MTVASGAQNILFTPTSRKHCQHRWLYSSPRENDIHLRADWHLLLRRQALNYPEHLIEWCAIGVLSDNLLILLIMPSYSSAQRTAISQFVAFTQAKESVAGRLLKSQDWSVERAVNAYYQGGESTSPVQQNLKKQFDSYRDNVQEEPDKIGIDGAQKYLEDLDVQLDEVAHFALCELLQCPSVGEFSRDEFVSGWKDTSSSSNLCDTSARQSEHVNIIRKQLAEDAVYFKKVYKYAFRLAKTEQQKSVPMDSALEFWNLFFRSGKGGLEWNSAKTKWLDLWLEFYESKVKRPVNKDLWNMVGELMVKTRGPEGETLEWWSEDGAWPMAVDDYVGFVKGRRNGMDTA